MEDKKFKPLSLGQTLDVIFVPTSFFRTIKYVEEKCKSRNEEYKGKVQDYVGASCGEIMRVGLYCYGLYELFAK